MRRLPQAPCGRTHGTPRVQETPSVPIEVTIGMTRYGDPRPQGDLDDVRRQEQLKEQADRERPPACSCPYDVVDGEKLPCRECLKYGFEVAAGDRPADCTCPTVDVSRGKIVRELPCWACYRDGFELPAETVSEGDSDAE